MRLDHLLSRDLGVCGGRGARTGASPGPLVACRGAGRAGAREHAPLSPLFCWVRGGCLSSFCCFLRVCVGCGGGGGGMLSGSGAACPIVSCSCFLLVGGLWGCGWVGCELYSGREYLCSLWCVFVVCLAPGSCCAVVVWWVLGVVCLCCVLFLWAFGGCLGTRGR